MRTPLLLLLVAILVVRSQALNEISCKDDSGTDVDWFVVQKIPRLTTYGTPTAPPGVALGTTYRFFLSTRTNPDWTISTRNIGDSTSMIGRTLVQANLANVVTIGYNDQPPDGSTGVRPHRAHAKGTLMINTQSGAGVWLIHSVPKFSDVKAIVQGTYQYPSTGTRNGQSFMCLNLDTIQIDKIGKHLYNMAGHVYDAQPANLVPGLQRPYPWLFRVIQNDFTQTTPGFSYDIVTRKQLQVKLVSKKTADAANDANDYDLWSERVAPHLQINQFVQSWQCGQGTPLPNVTKPDSGKRTESLEHLHIPWSITPPPKFVNWYRSPGKDHSKWGLSKTSTKPTFCIGDMNRRTTQTVRSGGVACFDNQNVWQTYWNILVNPNNVRRSHNRPMSDDPDCAEE